MLKVLDFVLYEGIFSESHSGLELNDDGRSVQLKL